MCVGTGSLAAIVCLRHGHGYALRRLQGRHRPGSQRPLASAGPLAVGSLRGVGRCDNLFLPLAPLGVRNALIVVTGAGCGPLMLLSLAVYLYGHAWAVIALACVFAVALAGLLASWLWLHRTYRARHCLPAQ